MPNPEAESKVTASLLVIFRYASQYNAYNVDYVMRLCAGDKTPARQHIEWGVKAGNTIIRLLKIDLK